ncbi:MAG: threonine ammonia-lyase, partial [Cyclobacteriaceae bacterium]
MLNQVVSTTPLQKNQNLSDKYGAEIYLKREDLQVVRSYKIRGAFNKIKSLSAAQLEKGIVCASAGNHAQGFAYSCRMLGITGLIFMPATTPGQKVRQVKMLGKSSVEVVLNGDTYDEAYAQAMEHSTKNGLAFIHPFDDEKIIEGQATVGFEILQEAMENIDMLMVPVGGGGLISGVGAYFKQVSPSTRIVGIEPAGAPAMKESLEQGKVVVLEKIEKFVDGAAVKKVGEINFAICQKVIDDMILVPEGKVCSTILDLYNEEAMVVEPAGALSIAALDFVKDEIKGKRVVCIVSGGNNDITRTEEIRERSLLYEGLKHYFIIRFPQRAGALREFLDNVVGVDDDITLFEYTKKTSREQGPALVGIEQKRKGDYELLIQRMKDSGINYLLLNDSPDLFSLLI